MSTNYTTNYGLCQWLATDQVQRTDFNQGNAKIDTALKSLSDQVGQKAEQADLASEVSARTAADAALSAAAIKIAVGSYDGNGDYGPSAARTLSFTNSLGRPPKVIFFLGFDTDRQPALLFHGMEYGFGGCTVTWSGNSVTWYGDTPDRMMNQKESTYYYLAIG